MADKLFVFGAGASHSAGTPLMSNFIDVAEDLLRDRSNEIAKEDFEIVFDLIQTRLPSLHAKSVVELSNIESVFSLIEMGRLLARLPGTKPTEIERAARAIRRMLTDTVELTCKFNLERGGHQWAPSSDYRRLVEGLFPKDGRQSARVAFITFNYDVALDFALRWKGETLDYAFSDAPGPGAPLFKLHGSLNWRACSKCGTLRQLDPLAALSKFGRQINVSQRGEVVPAILRVTTALAGLPPHCPGDVEDPEPAIVPPTWNKTQYHKAFGPVWRRAAAEVAEAQEIVVIGYSLPESDAFFRDLLALGLAGPKRLRKLVVVDPSPDVAERFRALLGPDVRRAFEPRKATFKEYLQETFGPQVRVSSLG